MPPTGTHNPLDWSSAGLVYAWDRGEAVRGKVLAAYRDRPVWILDGPSRTDDGFKFVGVPGSTK
jgi:hypothetical protein